MASYLLNSKGFSRKALRDLRADMARATETPDRPIAEIKAVIAANAADPTKGSFDGLRSSEIAEYNRVLMFGENDEAFPSQEDWSHIVD